MEPIMKLLENLRVKKILFIFPHPDDESFTVGGLIILARKLGIDTNVLCLTKGENGKTKHRKGKPLAKRRKIEFKKACQILGVGKSWIIDCGDSQLKEDIVESEKIMKSYIKKVNPDLVVTYDRGGFTGHPDHIATSTAAYNVCKKIGVSLLYYIPSQIVQKLIDNPARDNQSRPQYHLKNIFNIRKAVAFFKHKSQIENESIFRRIMTFILLNFASENYHLVDYDKRYSTQYVPFVFE